ncbi:hypothetical protein AMJ47_00455 [Parcubacteria bacterium DG_72]|nr:MAG: hypothetical protein AMJ47_00455 [Parcubacteria bacterium DG_72]
MKLSTVYSTQPSKFSAVAWSNNLEKSLKYFKDLGYEGIELAVRDPEKLDLQNLRNVLNKLSLPVAAIGTGQVFVDEGLSFSDPSTKQKAIERFKKHIVLGCELKCPVIIGCIRGKEVHKENFVNCLKVVGPYAKEKGVTLLIEPLNRYETSYLNKVSETIELVKELGEPFKVLLDTFHMNIEEPDLIETFKNAKEYIGHVHVADSNRLAPGSGHIDFASVINYLKEINYKGFISAEVMPFPSQKEAAEASYNYMKSLIKTN